MQPYIAERPLRTIREDGVYLGELHMSHSRHPFHGRHQRLRISFHWPEALQELHTSKAWWSALVSQQARARSEPQRQRRMNTGGKCGHKLSPTPQSGPKELEDPTSIQSASQILLD